MKKLLSILVCLTLILSALFLVGCNDKKDGNAETTEAAKNPSNNDTTDTQDTSNNQSNGNNIGDTSNEDTSNKTEETLKLGLGIVTTTAVTDATEDKNGSSQATMTAAVVLVDKDGKIVKAFVDCADSAVAHTLDGKAITTESFKTKYELGDDYNMKAYGGAAKEWYEQADAFCTLIVGKTASEVKALVAENARGTEDVINAGCTIYVSDFALAIEKAITNAVASEATAKDTIKLGVTTTQTAKDATEDVAGSNELATTFFAAAVNAEGKVVAASSDCVSVTFTFDDKGVSTFDTTKAVSSKKEAGDNYGMKTYGGAAKEWYEQAAAFDAACLGKTATEINGLAVNGKGNEALQSAGCTIYITDFVKAVAKIG